MDFRLSSGCEKWIDENGDSVLSAPYFSHLYRDKESQNLAGKYNPHFKIKTLSNEGFHSPHETHSFAENLLKICHAEANFVGFERGELSEYASLCGCIGESSNLFHMGFLREKKVKGEKIMFPTEKLVKLAFEKI